MLVFLLFSKSVPSLSVPKVGNGSSGGKNIFFTAGLSLTCGELDAGRLAAGGGICSTEETLAGEPFADSRPASAPRPAGGAGEQSRAAAAVARRSWLPSPGFVKPAPRFLRLGICARTRRR